MYNCQHLLLKYLLDFSNNVFWKLYLNKQKKAN